MQIHGPWALLCAWKSRSWLSCFIWFPFILAPNGFDMSNRSYRSLARWGREPQQLVEPFCCWQFSKFDEVLRRSIQLFSGCNTRTDCQGKSHGFSSNDATEMLASSQMLFPSSLLRVGEYFVFSTERKHQSVGSWHLKCGKMWPPRQSIFASYSRWKQGELDEKLKISPSFSVPQPRKVQETNALVFADLKDKMACKIRRPFSVWLTDWRTLIVWKKNFWDILYLLVMYVMLLVLHF